MKQFFLTILVLLKMYAVFSQANTKLSNLVSPTAVNQHLLPNTTNARDLGTSFYSWRNLYLRGYVYLDGVRFLSNHPGTGAHNTFVGSYAGNGLTSGTYNTALGHASLYKTTSGYANMAAGSYTLYTNTAGYSNTAVGTRTMYLNTTGYYNTAVGDSALLSNTTGSNNIAIGYTALFANTIGSQNVAIGSYALNANTTASNNTANGIYALFKNVQINNTAIGTATLYNNTTGYQNTAVGTSSLSCNTNGANNTVIGAFALTNNKTGSGNTVVGYGADVSQDGINNATAIGSNAIATASNQVMLGNTTVTSVKAAGSYVIYSDGRFKSDVKADVPGLEFINALRPVTYHYKIHELNAYLKPSNRASETQAGVIEKAETSDPVREAAITAKEQKVYTGFVAQEVEAAAAKLNYNFSGVYKPVNDKDVYGLSYADFVVPLVKAVQELDSAGKAKDEKITALDTENKEIKERLTKLEATIANGNSTLTFNSAFLEQNTPNPVSGTTTIRYHLPEGIAAAKLNVITIKGELVKTIPINSRGTGQVKLNTSILAAGTYNYTLYVDDKPVATKRLVIAR